VLARAGVPESRADALQREVENGSILLGVHVTADAVPVIREALAAAGGIDVETANWTEDS
jgi:hypothetical protein